MGCFISLLVAPASMNLGMRVRGTDKIGAQAWVLDEVWIKSIGVCSESIEVGFALERGPVRCTQPFFQNAW